MTDDTPLRVLVVDDNREAADSILGCLHDLGARAEMCLSGREALRCVSRFRPQVLMLDLDMPDMDGFQVAQVLRARPELKGAKIIAQTAYGDAETRLKTARAGFDLHLIKPLSFSRIDDMLNLLGSAFRLKREWLAI